MIETEIVILLFLVWLQSALIFLIVLRNENKIKQLKKRIEALEKKGASK